MTADERRELLRERSCAVARDRELPDATSSHPPAPGDVYVLGSMRELPVEWVLLEHRDFDESWLAVPADTHPAAGPGDLRIPSSDATGPLVLRCRHATPLSPHLLVDGRWTGAIGPEIVEEALHTHRAHRRGLLDPPPSARETADDREYRDWERKVPAAATEAVRNASVPRSFVPAPQRRGWIALAAVLAGLCFGLAAWTWHLRTVAATASRPLLIAHTAEVAVGDTARAPVSLEVHPQQDGVLLFILLDEAIVEHDGYRIELKTPEGESVWRSGPVARGSLPELNLILPVRWLERHPELRLLLYPRSPGADEPLAEATLRLGS